MPFQLFPAGCIIICDRYNRIVNRHRIIIINHCHPHRRRRRRHYPCFPYFSILMLRGFHWYAFPFPSWRAQEHLAVVFMSQILSILYCFLYWIYSSLLFSKSCSFLSITRYVLSFLSFTTTSCLLDLLSWFVLIGMSQSVVVAPFYYCWYMYVLLFCFRIF